jgi:microcystin degradation protein MlrC
MGMAFLCVTDGDPELAAEVARTVADQAWNARLELEGDGVSIKDALRHAAATDHHPVVLLDVGDNVGGGSPGDSTHVLAAAKRLGINGLFQSLCDPEAVESCKAAGIGGTVQLEVGGKTDDLHGEPISITGTVRLLDDGKFEDPGATHGGFRFFDTGHRAVVHTTDDHTLLINSLPLGNPSLQQLISAGIDPLTQPIIIAKGVHSPRGAFERQLLTIASQNTDSRSHQGDPI